MPNVCSAMNTCLSVRWQIHEQFLLLKAIEDSWWGLFREQISQGLIFLKLDVLIGPGIYCTEV